MVQTTGKREPRAIPNVSIRLPFFILPSRLRIHSAAPRGSTATLTML